MDGLARELTCSRKSEIRSGAGDKNGKVLLRVRMKDDRFGDCKTAACHATRLICGICSSFRSIALSRFCNGGSTAFFNSATVFSRSPTRL